MQNYGNLDFHPTLLQIARKNIIYKPFPVVSIIKNNSDLNKAIAYITELQEKIEREEQKIFSYYKKRDLIAQKSN